MLRIMNMLFDYANVWRGSWSSSSNNARAFKYAVAQRAVAQCAVAQRASQQANASAKPDQSQSQAKTKTSFANQPKSTKRYAKAMH